MEADLFVYCKCGDESTRNKFAELISEDTRPLVSEDVPEGQQEIFELLDELNFPESLVLAQDDNLMIHWWLGGNFDDASIRDDIDILLRAGVNTIKALLFIDGLPQQLFYCSGTTYKLSFFEDGLRDASKVPKACNSKELVAYFQSLKF